MLRSGLPRESLLSSKDAFSQLPTFDDFLARRDWLGAGAILGFEPKGSRQTTMLWRAYCAFHNAEYRKAQSIYEELVRENEPGALFGRALCHYAQGRLLEAGSDARQCGDAAANRLLCLIAYKSGDRAALDEHRARLTDEIPDRLTLAALHYLGGEYEAAEQIYNSLGSLLAVRVYTAMCLYKQDYHKEALEAVSAYLVQYPDSVFATNLLACCVYQLEGGAEAQAALEQLERRYVGSGFWTAHDLLRHNRCVFREGDGAATVFPALLDALPEARTNLAAYRLRVGDTEQALRLLGERQPANAAEGALKAAALVLHGQKNGFSELMKRAQTLFLAVGESAEECDTVLGRHCLGAFAFLQHQFDDSLIYYQSIAEALPADDDLTWNIGLSLAALGRFAEAEQALSAVQSAQYHSEFAYNAWLARCYIRLGRAERAWTLCLELGASAHTAALMRLVANESLACSSYAVAFKAFDALARLGGGEEGRRAAAMGVFADLLRGREEAFAQAGEVLEALNAAVEDEHCARIAKAFLEEMSGNTYRKP